MNFSAGALIASFLISTVGFGFFLYGKKSTRLPQLVTGVAMMVYPYFIASTFWMVGIAVVLVVALWLAVRSGL